MKNELKSIFVLCLYILLMIIIFFFAIQALKKSVPIYELPKEDVTTEISYVTEIVYVPIYAESEFETETESNTDDIREYIVKSYEGKIGVFTDCEKLVKVIDVYTKTLPKTDQNLLEKGLHIKSKAELYELIEDYTG